MLCVGCKAREELVWHSPGRDHYGTGASREVQRDQLLPASSHRLIFHCTG